MKTTATFAATALAICVAMPGFAQTKPAAPPAGTAPASKPTAPVSPPTAEAPKPSAPVPAPTAPAPAAAGSLVTPPPDYVIGVGDVLAISYYKEKDMTADYVVRPDGKITLPLLNDLDASGMTTDQLREKLTQASTKYFVDPNITVGVRVINSRKVFILGGVNKPGAIDLVVPLDVMSLIAVAGGLKEYVDGKDIVILRTERGRQTAIKFNYKEVQRGRNIEQNISLKPGDRVIVPE
jgi:polysaccharide export outer membrane protein